MNAVGIDVSKGKSMVAIMRPFGEIVSTPFFFSALSAPHPVINTPAIIQSTSNIDPILLLISNISFSMYSLS
jgi:hypothetical protein